MGAATSACSALPASRAAGNRRSVLAACLLRLIVGATEVFCALGASLVESIVFCIEYANALLGGDAPLLSGGLNTSSNGVAIDHFRSEKRVLHELPI